MSFVHIAWGHPVLRTSQLVQGDKCKLVRSTIIRSLSYLSTF